MSLNLTRNIDGTNYMTNFESADEIHCYNNGDGTFAMELQVWMKDEHGNQKQTTLKIPYARLDGIELLMKGDTLYTYQVQE